MFKLTVVVPTRERADTLVHTLQTLVEQDYRELEILVSDNCSNDNTRTVVASFDDPRIRYVTTDRRVDMSANWEFALSHATGDFITYIGDDDGLVAGAANSAMKILLDSGMPALVWRKAEYCWPDYVVPQMRNLIILETRRGEVRSIISAKQLQKVMRLKAPYTTLPCLYNGIVRTSLLREIRKLSSGGVFFNSIAPDVYSGIVLSQFIEEYLFSDYPFSVNGASRHSNGTASVHPGKAKSVDPAKKFLAEVNRRYDQRILLGPSVTISIMGEYLLAGETLGKNRFPEPDLRFYVRELLRSTSSSLVSLAVAESALHTAKQVSYKVTEAQHVRDCIQAGNKMAATQEFISTSIERFIAPAPMVKNIYDACALIGVMLPAHIASIDTSPFPSLLRACRRLKKYIAAELRELLR